jgi:hypothetical protein
VEVLSNGRAGRARRRYLRQPAGGAARRRTTRHGSADAISLTAPADLYSNSTVALDVETGKLRWYYQELPGDDWDADHNHEPILVHTRVSPDPNVCKMDPYDQKARRGPAFMPGVWSASPGRAISHTPLEDVRTSS